MKLTHNSQKIPLWRGYSAIVNLEGLTRATKGAASRRMAISCAGCLETRMTCATIRR